MTSVPLLDRRVSRLDLDKHNEPPSDSRLGYSIEEFAERVGIGRTLAYQAALRGEIPTRRIGRRLIVPRAALDTWFSDGGAA
jgi:excisionase family DNA binding protein